MNKNPAISVIMSVYNGEKYVRKGIESIINQTFTDWEMIVCDDGSTDNTALIIKEYCNSDPRIIMIKNEANKGLAFSLNECIKIARSNILARQDADDESMPNRFEVQYPFVVEHDEYPIVGTAWYNVDSGGETELSTAPELPRVKDMLWVGKFMHPTWMMRKDLIEKVDFYTPGPMTMRDQDYHLVMKVFSIGYRIYNMQIPLYLYTNDESAFKRTKNWKRVKGLMWVRFDSFKRNKLPFWDYIYVLKPLIKHLLPSFVTKKYYYRKQANGKK